MCQIILNVTNGAKAKVFIRKYPAVSVTSSPLSLRSTGKLTVTL